MQTGRGGRSAIQQIVRNVIDVLASESSMTRVSLRLNAAQLESMI